MLGGEQRTIGVHRAAALHSPCAPTCVPLARLAMASHAVSPPPLACSAVLQAGWRAGGGQQAQPQQGVPRLRFPAAGQRGACRGSRPVRRAEQRAQLDHPLTRGQEPGMPAYKGRACWSSMHTTCDPNANTALYKHCSQLVFCCPPLSRLHEVFQVTCKIFGVTSKAPKGGSRQLSSQPTQRGSAWPSGRVEEGVPPAGSQVCHLRAPRHRHRLRAPRAGKLAGAQLAKGAPAKGKGTAGGAQDQGVARAGGHLGDGLRGQGCVLHQLGLRRG